MKHSRGTAIFFSLMPGAGHMYLGLIRQGIQIMLLFFFTWFIAHSYDFHFFYIFIPIIWFYSIFDVSKKSLLAEDQLKDEDLPIFSNKQLLNNLGKGNSIERYIAYGLILLGFFSMIDNIVLPLLETYFQHYEFINYFRSFITAAVLIILGILLIVKTKKVDVKAGEEKCSQDE